MAVYAGEKGTDFVNAPEGLHDAVCVDVIDVGLKETQWGSKHKVKLVWEIAAKMEDGKPFIVSKQYNLTLSKNNAGVPSELRKDLAAWRGKDFTADELRGPDGNGFDLETVIGKCCQVLVQHQPSKDGAKTWANITAIMKPKAKLESAGKYIRQKDRTPKNGQPAAQTSSGPTEEPVEEIPF